MVKSSLGEVWETNLYEFAESYTSIGRESTNDRLILRNLKETIALGEMITQKIPNLKLLLLQGNLGVGKTALVKGLAKSLGILEPITSPTFALAQSYPQGEPPLIHMDLYRLDNPKDAYELFLQEEEEAHSSGAIMVVEWPERLGVVLPDAWQIHLQHKATEERIAQFIPPESEIKNNSTSSLVG